MEANDFGTGDEAVVARHTKGPWRACLSVKTIATVVTGPEMDQDTIADCSTGYYGWWTNQANAERIVACVNACADMPDPKQYILGLVNESSGYRCEADRLKCELTELRESHERLRKLVEDCLETDSDFLWDWDKALASVPK